MGGFDFLQRLTDHDNRDIRSLAINIQMLHSNYDEDVEAMNVMHNQSAGPKSGHDHLVDGAQT